jgi:hypothetical protein
MREGQRELKTLILYVIPALPLKALALYEPSHHTKPSFHPSFGNRSHPLSTYMLIEPERRQWSWCPPIMFATAYTCHGYPSAPSSVAHKVRLCSRAIALPHCDTIIYFIKLARR